MFAYYLRLGLNHLRRNPALTALMVVTLGVGVAASMSALTVLYAMSSDPIPGKSDRIFTPLLDSRPVDGPKDDDVDPPDQLTYRDAIALDHVGDALRRTALIAISPAIDAGRAELPPFFGEGVAVTTDFFGMLEVPFVHGAAWTAADDARAARVVVIRAALAAKMFGAGDPTGRTLRLGASDFIVTGVVPDSWRPLPRFYSLVGPGAFGDAEQLFLPFSTAIAGEMDHQGSTQCYANDPEPGYEGLKQSDCVWVQYWVELREASDAPAFGAALAGYVAEQRKLGRFPRPDNHRLHDVNAWLAEKEVVSSDTRTTTYLAFGFLLVCLVNTVGLLLAKFTARAGEIGVRRALGAARRSIFQQYLIEAGVVGLVGGVVGLLLTLGGLAAIRAQSDELAALAHLDGVMLATTMLLAVGASLLAGLLPTWRACQFQPAVQLKSQ